MEQIDILNSEADNIRKLRFAKTIQQKQGVEFGSDIIKVGYEYTNEVVNDSDYLHFILQKDEYVPDEEWYQQMEKKFQDLLINCQLEDRKKLGTIIGFTMVGLGGVILLGVSLVGLIVAAAGGLVGGLMGGYLGKKIKRKITKKKSLNHFDLYILKIHCLSLIVSDSLTKNKFSLNGHRFFLEKFLEELKPSLYHKQYDKHFTQGFKELFDTIAIEFDKELNLKAIYLTYKLTKLLLYKLSIIKSDPKQDESPDIQEKNFLLAENYQFNIAKVANNILQPFSILITKFPQQSAQVDEIGLKIEKLLHHKDMITILVRFPDQQIAPEKLQAFFDKLKTQVVLDDLKNYFDQEFLEEAIRQREKQEKFNEENKDHDPQEKSGKQNILELIIGMNSEHKQRISQQGIENSASAGKSKTNVEINSKAPIIQNTSNEDESEEESYKKQHININIQEKKEDEDNTKSNLQLNGPQPINYLIEQQQYDSISPQPISESELFSNCSSKREQNSDNKDNRSNQIIRTTSITHIDVNHRLKYNEDDNQEIKSKKIENNGGENNNNDGMRSSIRSFDRNQRNGSEFLKMESLDKKKQKYDKEHNLSNSIKNKNQLVHKEGSNTMISKDDQEIHNDDVVIRIEPDILRSPNQKLINKETESSNIQTQEQMKAGFEEQTAYNKEIEQNINQVLSILSEVCVPEKQWENVYKQEKLQINQRIIPGIPSVLVRCDCVVEGCNKEEVFTQIYNADLRKEWDQVTLGMNVIEKVDEFTDIIYFYVDPGFGFDKRDFLQRRIFRRDYPQKGEILIMYYSIDHQLCPPKGKGWIRANTYIAGYYIKEYEKDPNSCSLYLLTQCDIKGSIPKWIVNSIAAQAPGQWVETMKKGCEDYRKRQAIKLNGGDEKSNQGKQK